VKGYRRPAVVGRDEAEAPLLDVFANSSFHLTYSHARDGSGAAAGSSGSPSDLSSFPLP
jgi:hypothetical protein